MPFFWYLIMHIEAFSDDMREKNDWLKPDGFGQSDFLS